MIAKDIMTKGLKTIGPQATMQEAHNVMVKSGIRHLPVYDGNNIVGIVSDRDVQRAMTVINVSEITKDIHLSPRKIVSDYMTSPVLKINQHEEIRDIVREMVHKKLSCFIVMDDNKNNIGIITSEDLLLLLTDLLDSQTSFLQKVRIMLSKRNLRD